MVPWGADKTLPPIPLNTWTCKYEFFKVNTSRSLFSSVKKGLGHCSYCLHRSQKRWHKHLWQNFLELVTIAVSFISTSAAKLQCQTRYGVKEENPHTRITGGNIWIIQHAAIRHTKDHKPISSARIHIWFKRTGRNCCQLATYWVFPETFSCHSLQRGLKCPAGTLSPWLQKTASACWLSWLPAANGQLHFG